MGKKHFWKILAALLLLSVYVFNWFLDHKEQTQQIEEGQTIKNTNLAFYLPTSTTKQVIHHKGYSLSYSEPNEQAEWVAYLLDKNDLSSTDYKRPYFEIDSAVSTVSAHWKNYKNSGYDRGHLCPAADRSYSKEAHDETFLTSNISPQLHEFNAGIWNSLEQQVRYWAKKYDLVVVTGGVLTNSKITIGIENVTVPTAFYKIIYKPNQQKMLAFLVPHRESNNSLKSFVVSVDSIENLTGIDFFPQLNDSLENTLEVSITTTGWKL